MAMYPTQNKARMTATARKATGMPVRPVTAYAVGITPAATVIGAMEVRMKASTDGTPSRSLASACGIAPGLAACGRVLGMIQGSSGVVGGSGPAGEHGAVDGSPGLEDQLPQVGRQH